MDLPVFKGIDRCIKELFWFKRLCFCLHNNLLGFIADSISAFCLRSISISVFTTTSVFTAVCISCSCFDLSSTSIFSCNSPRTGPAPTTVRLRYHPVRTRRHSEVIAKVWSGCFAAEISYKFGKKICHII